MDSLEAIHREFMTAVGKAIPISNKCITTINAETHTLTATLLAASDAIMVASILIRALIIARQKLQPQQQQQEPEPSFGIVIQHDTTTYGGGSYNVSQVQPNSPADGKLDIGDLILQINGQKVSSANVSLSTKPETKLEVEVSKLNKQDFTYDKHITVVELVSARVPTYNAVDAALHEAISAAIFDSQNAIIYLDRTDPFENEKTYSDNVYTALSQVLNEMNTSLLSLSQQQPPLSTRTIVGLMKNALDIVQKSMTGVYLMYNKWIDVRLNLLSDAAKYYFTLANSSSHRTIDNLKMFSTTYLDTYLSAHAATANARLVESTASAASMAPAAAMQTPKTPSSFFGRLFKKGGGKKRRTNNKNKKTRNNKNKKTMNKNKNKKTMMTIRRKKV
jgi:hypothetical protein